MEQVLDIVESSPQSHPVSSETTAESVMVLDIVEPSPQPHVSESPNRPPNWRSIVLWFLRRVLRRRSTLDGRGADPDSKFIEIQLEHWLVDNWSQVDFGAPLRLYEESGQPVGQQYDTGVGRIDLLCEDASSGAIVVIKLKKGRQSDDVMGQLARYMGWVRENLANGRPVEGVVLAPALDERLRYSAMAIPGVRLLQYETRFEIFPM